MLLTSSGPILDFHLVFYKDNSSLCQQPIPATAISALYCPHKGTDYVCRHSTVCVMRLPRQRRRPFTLMSLIRTIVHQVVSLLLFQRSWKGFLTVGTLVLTLAPSSPSDSEATSREGGAAHGSQWDSVRMSGSRALMEHCGIWLQRSVFLSVHWF